VTIKKVLILEIDIMNLTNFPSLKTSVHLQVLEDHHHLHQPTEAGMAVPMSVQHLLWHLTEAMDFHKIEDPQILMRRHHTMLIVILCQHIRITTLTSLTHRKERMNSFEGLPTPVISSHHLVIILMILIMPIAMKQCSPLLRMHRHRQAVGITLGIGEDLVFLSTTSEDTMKSLLLHR
jgi:hypothetical protein